jgi:hypothetical protein
MFCAQPPQLITMDFSALGSTANVPIETARTLLQNWASAQCCYGTDAAKISNITSEGATNSLAIQMDTFVETRHASQEKVPYRHNEPVLFPAGAGIPPQAWQLQLPAHPFFVDSTTKHEVPFTSTVMPDHVCGGDGRVRCHRCGGDGRVRCEHCNGDGRVSQQL